MGIAESSCWVAVQCRWKESGVSMTKRLLITGGVAAILMASGGVADANLIVNGGFESGNLTGWTASGLYCSGVGTNYSAASGCVGQDTNPGPNSGTYSLYLGPNPGFGTVSQTLATTLDHYTVSFWLANSSYLESTTPNQFQVTWNGAPLLNQVDAAAFPYTFYSFDVIGAAGTSILAFNAIQFPSAWNLDDVSVEAVPEPTTLALLGAGLVALRARRRRSS
jgi:hypothetical protein